MPLPEETKLQIIASFIFIIFWMCIIFHGASIPLLWYTVNGSDTTVDFGLYDLYIVYDKVDYKDCKEARCRQIEAGGQVILSLLVVNIVLMGFLSVAAFFALCHKVLRNWLSYFGFMGLPLQVVAVVIWAGNFPFYHDSYWYSSVDSVGIEAGLGMLLGSIVMNGVLAVCVWLADRNRPQPDPLDKYEDHPEQVS